MIGSGGSCATTTQRVCSRSPHLFPSKSSANWRKKCSCRGSGAVRTRWRSPRARAVSWRRRRSNWRPWVPTAVPGRKTSRGSPKRNCLKIINQRDYQLGPQPESPNCYPWKSPEYQATGTPIFLKNCGTGIIFKTRIGHGSIGHDSPWGILAAPGDHCGCPGNSFWLSRELTSRQPLVPAGRPLAPAEANGLPAGTDAEAPVEGAKRFFFEGGMT